MKIAGLDIGTTGCKLTVFDGEGRYLDRAYCDYPVTRGKSEHEVDASAIRQGVLGVIRAMSEKHPDISGIGITSFGETFVLTDEAGEPLLHAMLYTDARGKNECAELVSKLGEREIARISGLRPHEMYSISKIMWVKSNRPDVYEKVRHIFLIADYIVFLLTGKAQIDYQLATRTMAFDIRKLTWSRAILEAAGVDAPLLSKPVPAGTAAGKIKPEVAEKTGLSPETVIVTACHDQVAAAVGSGVFDTVSAVDGAGTVECITPVFDGIPESGAMFDGYYSIIPYVIPGKYVCYAFTYTGGALVQWCADTLAKKEKDTAREKGVSVYALLEEPRDREGPTGLLVLPHFAGAATPYMDTGSKGAIIGLTAANTVSDIYLACLEGVAYEMRLNMEKLAGAGIRFGALRATGGGANSKLWMQMKADILNIPIVTLSAVDAGAAGCAMLTGIAVGCFRDLDDAARRMVRERDAFYPRKEQHEQFMKVYERYRRLYDAVRPLV
ncbi:MAG: L-fuculokinase [Oscillospiraceae bacterium]